MDQHSSWYLKLRLCGVQVWLLLEPYQRTCCGAARAAGAMFCSGAARTLNQPFPPALDSTVLLWGIDPGTLALHQLYPQDI